MKTLYESIMDDDEVVMSHAKESSLRLPIEQMLDSGKADKQLIKELESTVAVYPVNDKNIKDIVVEYIRLVGKNCSLNWIDTSKVTNMDRLFSSNYYTRPFNGDISKWNVSNVVNMYSMFRDSEFNGDISNWDVSSVVNMAYMFCNTKFDQDISKWDVSNVKYMIYMFSESKFNKDISKWNVSNVEDMSGMFGISEFDQDISNWDVKKVRRSRNVFTNCPISPDHKPNFLI